MTALLQGLLHITDFGGPLTKTTLPVVATCFAIQNVVGIPSVSLQTEHVYDLSGGVTFVAASAVSILAQVLRRKAGSLEGLSPDDFNWRQLAMTGGVMVYATRCMPYRSLSSPPPPNCLPPKTWVNIIRYLSLTNLNMGYNPTSVASYLYRRILKRGEDSRFRRVRDKPRRFIIFWQVQAVWVALMLAPVITVNAIPQSAFTHLPRWTSVTDTVGFLLWTFGFVFECTADYQKSSWLAEKTDKVHDEQFITSGLFSTR